MSGEFKPQPLRCDVCGKFVSYEDLEEGRAIHHLITPDSLCSTEEFETLCRDHYQKGGEA